MGYTNLDLLNEKLKKFMVRRTKEESSNSCRIKFMRLCCAAKSRTKASRQLLYADD